MAFKQRLLIIEIILTGLVEFGSSSRSLPRYFVGLLAANALSPFRNRFTTVFLKNSSYRRVFMSLRCYIISRTVLVDLLELWDSLIKWLMCEH